MYPEQKQTLWYLTMAYIKFRSAKVGQMSPPYFSSLVYLLPRDTLHCLNKHQNLLTQLYFVPAHVQDICLSFKIVLPLWWEIFEGIG